MVAQQFVNIIQQTEQLNQLDLKEVETWCEQYPYALAPKLIKAKLLKTSSPVAFKAYLKTAAIYSYDRKMLYRFLISEEVREKVSELVKNNAHETVINQKNLKEANEIETPEQNTNPITRLEHEPKGQVEAGFNTEAPIIEGSDTPGQIDDKIETEIDQLTDAVLDELIMSAVPTYNIESIYQDDELEELEVSSEPIKEEEATLHASEKSFLDWLDNFDKMEGREEKHGKLSQSDIINSFIEKQPRIRSVKGEQPSIIEINATDRSQIVTETLARIYLKQENYKKAIQVYEQLILNIPEKKGYFASQIHFLENLLKKD